MKPLVIVLALLAMPLTAAAQFGHPLKGQWSGEWNARGTPVRLLLDLHWDGKAITGVINPGPQAVTIRKVTIDFADPAAWGVKLEADGIVADATLENIGAYRRVLRGTWTQGGQKGTFVLTRN